MSDRPPTMITLSTLQLSADGTRALPGENERRPVEVTVPAALAALQAFAGLPAVELVDVDAKMYLEGPRGKVAVQNVGGKLFVALVPESVNTATHRTPAETMELIVAGEARAGSAAATAEAAEEAALIADAARSSGGWRKALSSGWTLALLLIVAAIVGYVSFAPEIPEGVEIIRDPGRIASLNTEFSGRYGAPAATILVLADGKLTGKQAGPTSVNEETLFEMGFRFGLRGTEVVLVVDNGALLEPQPDHSLRYLDSVYPRREK